MLDAGLTAEQLGRWHEAEGGHTPSRVLREGEGGESKEHQAVHAILLSFSSFSDRIALTGATRKLANVMERRVE